MISMNKYDEARQMVMQMDLKKCDRKKVLDHLNGMEQEAQTGWHGLWLKWFMHGLEVHGAK